ncbi:MAG: hypothetical protein KC645_11695 [Gemmatimonadetes bacterium]|nr:hypothetical protein [Gemmatimonadota bacterium]
MTPDRDPPPVSRDALRPGDVLLMYGDAAVSDLIRDLAGGDYSHAGFWSAGSGGDGGDVIDAGPAGVLHVPLDERLYSERYVDVWRWRSKDGHGIGEPGWPESDVEQSFARYLNSATGGTRFAYHRMFMVALLFIAKAGTEHVPGKRIVRLLLEWALEVMDQWLSKGTTAVTCSGLVYRGFDEALHGGHPHRYQIAVDNPYVLPAPVGAVGDAQRAETTARLETALDRLDDGADLARTFLLRYAASTGFDTVGEDVAAAAAHVYADFVTPADLQRSPNLTLVGRLVREYDG